MIINTECSEKFKKREKCFQEMKREVMRWFEGHALDLNKARLLKLAKKISKLKCEKFVRMLEATDNENYNDRDAEKISQNLAEIEDSEIREIIEMYCEIFNDKYFFLWIILGFLIPHFEP